MLGDHSPRIHAQHQQALENAVMEDLEKRVAPLLMAVLLVVLAITISALADSVTHYIELDEVNDAMAACINGHAISLGDAELKCSVREYKKLVSGLAQGEQL